MASLIKKKKGNRLYYYLVESARVDGQPRIVHQAYLGTAEKLAELVQQKSAPVPLSTNFYTYIASTNTRNQLAQRGHNKQGRHNLRQVGLSYVLDGESGLSLCHHVYPGNVADVEEFSVALARIVRLLDQNQMARDTVTLVFDKGTAALNNTVQLQEAGVGWISALPWNQAPQELRDV